MNKSRTQVLVLLASVIFLIAIGCGDSSNTAAAVPTEPGFIYNYSGGKEGLNLEADTKDEALFRLITDLAVGGDWLYVADHFNHIISRINLIDHRYEIVAGTGEEGGMPATGARIRETPLPSIRSIAVNADASKLYAVLLTSLREDAALIEIDLNSGSLEVLLQAQGINDVRVLDASQLLVDIGSLLFVHDLETSETREFHPGVSVRAMAVGYEETVYVGIGVTYGSIRGLDTETNSQDLIAGPFQVSPLLEQVRDDARSLDNAYPQFNEMAVAPTGHIAVGDYSRYGILIGLLQPDEGTFTVIAGQTRNGAAPNNDIGDAGPAIDAIVRPVAMAFDNAGNLYLANATSIRRINRPPALD